MKKILCIILFGFFATDALAEETKYREQALKELQPSQKTPLSETTATITVLKESKDSFWDHPDFFWETQLQIFQPMGTSEIVGEAPYSLSELNSQPMVNIGLNWLTENYFSDSSTQLGGYLMTGFSQHLVKPSISKAITGASVRMNALLYEVGAVGVRPWKVRKHLFLRARGFAGGVSYIQSSELSVANKTTQMIYAGIGAEVAWFFKDHWALTGAYRWRSSLRFLTDSKVNVPEHNLLVGLNGFVY